MIDEIIVLNLPSDIERKWAFMGSAIARRVPIERIRFWEAVPASDFGSPEAFVSATEDDGWTCFRKFLIDDGILDEFQNPIDFKVKVQAWSYCQMLRFIIEKKKNAIIIYDDRFIIEWEIVLQIFDTLAAKNEIKFWQLENYPFLHVDPHFEATPHWIPGLQAGPSGGGENAIVYTAEGAKWLLNYLIANFDHNIEMTLAKVSFLPPKERIGIYSSTVPYVHGCDALFGSNIFLENNKDMIRTLDGTGITK